MYEHYMVHADANEVVISGDIAQTVRLDVDGYCQQLLSLPSTNVRELITIASGIYAIDRLSKKRMGLKGGVRQLHVSFGVHNLHFWASNAVREALLEVISFLTDDDWQINFESQSNLNKIQHQDYLNFARPLVGRIALYSGGLDSAAGLAHQLFIQGLRDYLVITVGHYSALRSHVKRQLADLENIGSLAGYRDISLLHSTLTTSLKDSKDVRMRDRENSQRSRGLLFCAAGVGAAEVSGLNTVEVFENGVGAINLPVMTGMLGRGLATRGANPSFLTKMSTLASLVLERRIEFVLPFDNFTKGEMLGSIGAIPGIGQWLQKSHSCIHTSLRERQVNHCGECPACIERRQAFLTAKLPIELEDYQLDILRAAPSNLSSKEYFYLYRLNAIKLLEGDPESYRRVAYHCSITDMPHSAYKRIAELQLRHSREILTAFGSPFIGDCSKVVSSPETHAT